MSNLAQRFEKHVHSGDVHPSIINGVQALMSGTLTDWAAKRLWRALCPRSSFPDALSLITHPSDCTVSMHLPTSLNRSLITLTISVLAVGFLAACGGGNGSEAEDDVAYQVGDPLSDSTVALVVSSE